MAQYSPVATGLTNSHTPISVLPPLPPCCAQQALLCSSGCVLCRQPCSLRAVEKLLFSPYHICTSAVTVTVCWQSTGYLQVKSSFGRTGCTGMHTHTHSCMPSFIKTRIHHVCKYKWHKFHHLWNVHYFSVTRQSRKWERQLWEMMWKQWSSRIHGHIIRFSSKGKALFPTSAKKKKKKRKGSHTRKWGGMCTSWEKRKYVWMLTTC